GHSGTVDMQGAADARALLHRELGSRLAHLLVFRCARVGLGCLRAPVGALLFQRALALGGALLIYLSLPFCRTLSLGSTLLLLLPLLLLCCLLPLSCPALIRLPLAF